MSEEKKVKLIKPFREGESEAVALGDSSMRYTYKKADGTEGTFGSIRKVFRCINEQEEYGGSTKFKVGLTVFAPGEGGPVHVHENSEEFSYIIQGGGIQLDREGNIVGTYEKGDVKFVPAGAYHGGFCTSDEPLVMLWAYSDGGELPKE